MLAANDGFRIAEEDLRLSGMGEFFGTRQHGLPEFKIGDIINDYAILKLARDDAFKLVNESQKSKSSKKTCFWKGLQKALKISLI